MVFREENLPDGHTHPRGDEHYSRPPIQVGSGQARLDVKQVSIQETEFHMGSAHSRPVCIQSVSTASQILQLEAGSGGRDNRRICTKLVWLQGIRKSTMVCDREVHPAHQEPESHNSAGDPIMDLPAMVCSRTSERRIIV